MPGFCWNNDYTVNSLSKHHSTLFQGRNGMTYSDYLKNCKFDELELQFREIASADQVPIAKLALYATASMKHLAEYETSFRDLKGSGGVCIGCGISDQNWYPRVVELFAATLEQASNTGTIRAVDHHRVGRMYLDAILSLMMHRVGSTPPNGIEDDVRVLMDLYLNGLRERF
ncbi:MAG: hypothetical protein ACR2PB_13210 [Desulfocapsaceae bacterium]